MNDENDDDGFPRVNTSPDVSPNDSAANARFQKRRHCVSRPYVEHAPVSRERRGYPLFPGEWVCLPPEDNI